MNHRLALVFLTLFAALTAGPSAAQSALVLDPAKLRLASLNAVVVDASAKRSVYAKGADAVTPIASLTKLMTAMVTLDAGLSPDETITIDMEAYDLLARRKKAGQSFSEVIKEHFGRQPTAAAFVALARSVRVSPDAVSAMETLVNRRSAEPARAVKR